MAKTPLAVIRSGKVLDASAEARRMGITPGMANSEARYASRSSEVRFVNYKPEDYLELSRRWMDTCCEFSSVLEPVEPQCAFLDLSALPGAREMAVPLAADLYHSIKLCPRIGIASSKLTARLAPEPIPEGCDASFLAPLSIHSLWLARAEHLRRLDFLGYRLIGDVAKLPQQLLVEQFGQEGVRISLLARGAERSAVRALYPPDELSARFRFIQPARKDAELEAGLKYLANHLGEILQARDQQTTQIQIEAAFENQTAAALRTFSKPMQSPGALLTGLRLSLRMLEINQDVYSLYARFPNVETAQRKQLTLDSTNKNKKDVENALKRVKETFGNAAIKKADEVVVSRRQQLLGRIGWK